MLKAICVAACLVLGGGALSQPLAQQAIEPLVIVPDTPGGGGGGGGGTAVTTTNLNVRSGPGTRFAVVDVLQRGQRVRIETCRSGWCRIERRGPEGWVSQNFLSMTGGGGGGGGVVRPPRREVCFYDQPRMRGRSFCALPGDSNRSLGSSWNNRISSMSIRGLTTVQVCADRNFQDCDAFNRDVSRLPRWLDRNVSSYRVFH